MGSPEHYFCDGHLDNDNMKKPRILFGDDKNNEDPIIRFRKRSKIQKGPKPDLKTLSNYAKMVTIDAMPNETEDNSMEFYSFGLAVFSDNEKFVNLPQNIYDHISTYNAEDDWTTDETFPYAETKWKKQYKRFYFDSISLNCYRIEGFFNRINRTTAVLCIITGSCLTGNDFQIVATNIPGIKKEQHDKYNYFENKCEKFWGQMPLCSFHFEKSDILQFHGFEWEKLNNISVSQHKPENEIQVYNTLFMCNHAFFYFLSLVRSLQREDEKGHFTANFKMAFSEAVHVSHILRDSVPFCQMFGFASHIFFYRKYVYYNQMKSFLQQKENTSKHILGAFDIKKNITNPWYFKAFEDNKSSQNWNRIVTFKNTHFCNRKELIGDICSSFFATVLDEPFSKEEVWDPKVRGAEDLIANIGSSLPATVSGELASNKELVYGFWKDHLTQTRAPENSDDIKTKILDILRCHRHLPQENRLLQFKTSDLEIFKTNDNFIVIVTLPFVYAMCDARGATSARFKMNLQEKGTDVKKKQHNFKPVSQYHVTGEYWGVLKKFNDLCQPQSQKKIFLIPQKCFDCALETFVYHFPYIDVRYKIHAPEVVGADSSKSRYNHWFSLDLQEQGVFSHGSLCYTGLQHIPPVDNFLIHDNKVWRVVSPYCQLLDQIKLSESYNMYRLHYWNSGEGSETKLRVLFYICSGFSKTSFKESKDLRPTFT